MQGKKDCLAWTYDGYAGLRLTPMPRIVSLPELLVGELEFCTMSELGRC